MNQIAMALKTIALEDPTVAFLDHDGFVKILERESLGMMIAVAGLGQLLRQPLVWQVTINTCRQPVMAGLLPGVVLRLHDVAIGTGGRIRAEIGEPLGIVKREHTDPGQRPGEERDDGQTCRQPGKQALPG